MNNRLKIALLSGGKSAEHEVSLVSAANIFNAINKEKYDVIQLKINKKGVWFLNEKSVVLSQNYGERVVIEKETGKVLDSIDVLFPVLHGPYGEDGTVQGLAKLAGIPCVGPGILASSVGMDKDVAKRLLRDAGIGIARFFTLRKSKPNEFSYESIIEELGNELFVKPSNMGSSVGVSSAKNKEEFEKALTDAFLYDDKVIVEEKITGREIECAVLGNDFPKASIPGEIIPTKSFYSYESKYLDDNDARLDIPAKLDEEIIPKIQDLAIKTYQCLECKGMTRVDMFMKADSSLVINEINTIPGFTKISMYPALWAYSGIPQSELIDQLIQFAIEEFEHQNKLENSFTNSIKQNE